MGLQEMISGGLTWIAEIGEYLDGLDHKGRLSEIHRLSATDMKGLYERAAAAGEITLSHFVPDGCPDRTEVIHDGMNSLPAFRRFQKRFCRSVGAQSGNAAVFGYNEGMTRPLLGPGYFVAHPTAGMEHWESRGAVVIDYHLTPDGRVPDRWPAILPNEVGLQSLVYSKTRDFMRKVSAHVSIGAAFKYEHPIGAYFVLCRRP